jgi:hypothetical protein
MDLEEEKKIEILKSLVDDLCDKIRNQKISLKQAQIETGRVREKAEKLIPDKMDKFDLIYQNRFKRLIQQFLMDE